MFQPRVIPVLLLQGSGLVKTVKFKAPTYVGDPINTIRIFNEKEVDELLILDISSTPGKTSPNLDVIRELASEAFMPVGYGGGVTDVAEIEALFRAGLEKVTLNSAVFTRPGLVREASRAFGAQSIVVSMDVKKTLFGGYSVFSHGGLTNQKVDPVEHARRMEEAGAGELLVNAIDRDGMCEGLDLALVRKVASAVSIPVVACGGAGKLADFREAVDAGASAVAAGSFFVFHGKHRAVLITYPSPRELDQLFATTGSLLP